MSLTHEEMEAVLGPVDNALAADILATGATKAELAQAWTWVNSDDAQMDEGRSLPSGRVAQLIDILQPPEDDDR